MNGENLHLAASIYERIWELSPTWKDHASYNLLQEQTKQLIKLYKAEGLLREDPFAPTMKRVLSLPENELVARLKGATCVVTGGLGCVGRTLVKTLLTLEVNSIIVIDKNAADQSSVADDRITYVQANILDGQHLNNIFERFHPHYVFHTAAQRDPGYAERHVYETVNENIIGTWNVIQACETTRSVRQCVFSSTGKASRYFTREVYAATKKICEYLFDTYARNCNVLYSVVRFTHILENSLMNAELRNIGKADHQPVHSPGKYVTAQNVFEAAHLMLNALLHAKTGQCSFLIARHLEWPVESLEVALYHIDRTNSRIPVVFKGNPPGYTEKFFRGQVNWAKPAEINQLINVYEHKTSYLNAGKDILIFHIPSTEKYVLRKALVNFQQTTGEQQAKICLLLELRNIVRASLKYVNETDTVQILQWGLNPQYLAAEKSTVDDFREIVDLLQASVNHPARVEKIADLMYAVHEQQVDYH